MGGTCVLGARDGVAAGVFGEGTHHGVAAVAHVDASVPVAQVQVVASRARRHGGHLLFTHGAHYDGVFAVRLGVARGYVVARQARGGHILPPPAGALRRRVRQCLGALGARRVAALHQPRVIQARLAWLQQAR